MTMTLRGTAELSAVVPLRGMRGAIACAMVDSLRNTAQFTLHREYDSEALTAFRDGLHATGRPSLNDLVLAATARVLRRHPDLNASIDEERRAILQWADVHVGMAVAVGGGGLLVPVIRNAADLGLDELAQATRRLVRLAHEGGVSLTDMSHGTFTVTNLGAAGVDAFTPILNRPQVAILGVGRMRGPRSTLSLTVDHRAVDGAPAGRFLSDLAGLLESPTTLATVPPTAKEERHD